MHRLRIVACFVGLLAASTSLAGGTGYSSGPSKLMADLSRPALRAQVTAFTWSGRSGHARQALPTARPVSALGAITPPMGEWDTVTLHFDGPVSLETGDGVVALPLRSLEVVLEEPVSGGARIQLTLDLELRADVVQGRDVETLISVLSDGARLSLREE